MKTPHNKIIFSAEQKVFIRENYEKLTNQQLADSLGFKKSRLRKELYDMGLKRMTLEYWTAEQLDFLQTHYRTKGDTEIARLLNELYPRKKVWAHHNIEKKLLNLGLSRSERSRQLIKERNLKSINYSIGLQKYWENRGRTPNGSIRVWKRNKNGAEVVIKTEKGFVSYARYKWELQHGPIPKGHVVRHKDRNSLNCAIENLMCISQKVNAVLNKLNGKPIDLVKLSETQKSGFKRDRLRMKYGLKPLSNRKIVNIY